MANRKRRGNDTERAPGPPPDVPPVVPPVVSVMSEAPPDPDEPSPMGDILLIDQAKMQALSAKGVDTTIARVRVERFSEEQSRFVRQDGEFPPDMVTVKWLRKKYGPGRYFCRAHNAGGMYMGGGGAVIEKLPEPVAAAPVVAPTVVSGPGAGGGLTFEQQMLLTLVQGRATAVPPPQDDGLRETLAAMSRMIALQVQTATMNQVKGQLAGTQNGSSDERFLSLLDRLVGQKSAREPMGFKEFLPILQLGIGLGARANGTPGRPNPENDIPPWLQIVPDLADTVGVPLIVAIAQATLPPDKAEAVLNTITEHQKARQKEAERPDLPEEPE